MSFKLCDEPEHMHRGILLLSNWTVLGFFLYIFKAIHVTPVIAVHVYTVYMYVLLMCQYQHLCILLLLQNNNSICVLY